MERKAQYWAFSACVNRRDRQSTCTAPGICPVSHNERSSLFLMMRTLGSFKPPPKRRGKESELILVMPQALLVEDIRTIYDLYTIHQWNLCRYLASKHEPEPPFPFSGSGRS